MKASQESEWGEISGERFFARSPFRSGFFLVATGVCCATLLCILWVAITNWGKFSLATPMVLLYAAAYIIRLWIGALRSHQDIQVLVEGDLLKFQEHGAPLRVVLDAGARTLNDGLFFSAMTVGMLVLFIGQLLGRTS